MPAATAQNDLDFYVPRTDPTGPSMSDAVNEIDSSALGTPGCSAYVYTERSYQPFIRDAFDQFSETRTGGAFTFMTGIGGFLQEFLYGYSGLRWTPQGVRLDPSLSAQLRGVTLRGLSWRGRRFTVAIGLNTTTVRLTSGAALPVIIPAGRRTVTARRPLTLATRRPDLRPTPDAVRCARAVASSAQPGAPALAAVDGSPATAWQPSSLPATLTAPVRGLRRTAVLTVRWGRQWPAAPGPNIPPPPGPVITLRPSRYQILVSADGRRWRTVATITRASGTLDTLRLPGLSRARLIRVRIVASAATQPPMLDELSVR